MTGIISVMTICAVIGLAVSKPADYYATRYDHIDVDAILNNRRMVNYYAACLLNKGPCPPQGIEFKRILPEALETNCKRCTEKQKTIALRTIKRIRKEYPKIWQQLKQVWDPDDIYVRKFEATFGKKKSTDPKPQIFNRFGDDDSTESNEISNTPDEKSASASRPVPEKTDAPTLFTSSSSTVFNTSVNTKSPRVATKASTANTETFTTTTKAPTTTTKATTTTTRITAITTPTPSTYDISNIFRINTFKPSNANVDATVSFGGKVVNNLVKGLRGLETVTKKVAETGANLAGALITSIQTVARPLVLL